MTSKEVYEAFKSISEALKEDAIYIGPHDNPKDCMDKYKERKKSEKKEISS